MSEKKFKEGISRFKQKDYLQAIHCFENSIEIDSNHHKAWNAMGICYSILKMYGEADQCFRNAITISPNNAVYNRNLLKNKRKIPSPKVHFSLSKNRTIGIIGMSVAVILIFSIMMIGSVMSSLQAAQPMVKTPPIQDIIPASINSTVEESPTLPIITPTVSIPPTQTPIPEPTQFTLTPADNLLFSTIDAGDTELQKEYDQLFSDWDKYNEGYILYYEEMQKDLTNIQNIAQLYRDKIKPNTMSSRLWNYRDEIDDAFRKIGANALHISQMLAEYKDKDRKALRNQAHGEMAAHHDYITKATFELKKSL